MTGLRLLPGEWVRYGERRGRIVRVPSLQEVMLRDERGELFTVRPDQLMPDQPRAEERTGTVTGHPLDSAEHRRAVEVAAARLAVIEPLLRLGPSRTREDVERVSEEKHVHATTLYRWLKRYEDAGSVDGLVRRPRSGSTRLDAGVEVLMDRVIERYYLTLNRPSLRSVYERLRVEAGRAGEGGGGLVVPSYSTFRRRVDAIEERRRVSRRYGHRAAESLDPIRGHYPGATYPLAVVQVDHTPIDLILVDPVYRLPVGRPWLTLVMDVFSRVVLGFYVSFDSPSAFGSGMALAHAIQPKEGWISRHQEALEAVLLPREQDGTGEGRTWEQAPELRWDCYGKPVLLKMDNAKEFRGKVLERALMSHGIDREFRPVMKPRYGAHVERLLGTLAREIHTLPGTTFSNVRERGDYDSEGNAVFTLDAFETWLTAYITGVYHRRIHEGLGMTPLAAWEEGLLEGTAEHPPTGLPERIEGDAAARLRMDLMPYFEATVQPYGIRHEGVTYMGPVLRGRVTKHQPGRRGASRKYQVSYDPRDVSKVYFLDPDLDRYFEIHSRQANFPTMSIWELRAARRYARKHALRMEHERDIMAAFRAMSRLVEEEEASTRKARVRTEKKRHHARTPGPGREGAVPAKPPSPVKPALNIFESLGDIEPFDDIDM